MSQQKQQAIQADKLQQIKDKPVSENIKKSVEEKQKYINKPINK